MKVCSRCQKEKKDSSYPNRSSICSACYVKAYRLNVKASGINWHPDDYQPCTDEEELLRRIELADREHRLLLKEKR